MKHSAAEKGEGYKMGIGVLEGLWGTIKCVYFKNNPGKRWGNVFAPSMLSIPKGIDDTLRSVMVLNLLGKEFKGLFNGTGSVLP